MIITNATRPSRRKVYFLSHYITTSSRAKLAFTLPSVKEKSAWAISKLGAASYLC